MLKLSVKRPYLACWLIVPLLLLSGFLGPNETLEVNVKNTYWVVGLYMMTTILSITAMLMGLIYWSLVEWVRGQLYKLWTAIHITSCTVSFVGIIMIIRYPHLEYSNSLFTVLFLGTIISFISFLINLILSSFRLKRLGR